MAGFAKVGGKRVAVAVACALATVMVSAAERPQGSCTRSTADRRATPTSACTGCHASSSSSGARNLFQMPGHDFGHPVDVDLDAARSTHPDRFAAASQLPAFLPLADGKITCLTCHDGRAGHRSSLARASITEMCLGCHRM